MATSIKPDYLSDFIINARRLPLDDGNFLRQPTPDEALGADSAFRLAYEAVMNDKRLADLAADDMALKLEAARRGRIGEALYMVPLLLEAEDGKPLFNVYSDVSLEKFEEAEQELITLWTVAYEMMTPTPEDVKKK